MGLSESSCSHGCQEPPDSKFARDPDDGDIICPKVVVVEAAEQGNYQLVVGKEPEASQGAKAGFEQDCSETPAGEAAESFVVNIDMTDASAKMGIVVDFSNDYSMIVKSINPGLIQRWNLQNPEQQVREQDHIVEVNGTRGSAEQLVNACRTQARLELLVNRLASSALSSNGVAGNAREGC